MKSATSKFVFALIIGAYIVGRIYMLFVPAHTIENNLELNAGYYPSINEESVNGSTQTTRGEEPDVNYGEEN